MSKLIDLLSRVKCPNCGQRRLLAGPFYDQWRVTCQQCGKKFKLKERKLT